MKKQFVGSTIALAALVGMAGCASPQETAAPKATASAAVTPPVREQSYTPGEAAGEKITIVATVVAIDLATRHVTLRWPEGGTDTIVVGEEVRNLPQVRVGDRVVIEYYQGLALALEPSASGIRKRTDMVTGERAAPGQKPAGVVTRTVEVDATVQAVDRQARTVTLRGPKRTVILKVAADVDLNKVKVGDGVHAIYQEALAVSVAPAAVPLTRP
jgi:Cu/Ag efflux protein CusF